MFEVNYLEGEQLVTSNCRNCIKIWSILLTQQHQNLFEGLCLSCTDVNKVGEKYSHVCISNLVSESM